MTAPAPSLTPAVVTRRVSRAFDVRHLISPPTPAPIAGPPAALPGKD